TGREDHQVAYERRITRAEGVVDRVDQGIVSGVELSKLATGLEQAGAQLLEDLSVGLQGARTVSLMHVAQCRASSPSEAVDVEDVGKGAVAAILEDATLRVLGIGVEQYGRTQFLVALLPQLLGELRSAVPQVVVRIVVFAALAAVAAVAV